MPMTPAPPLDCSACHRTIGKRAGHNLTEDRRLLCTKCLFNRKLHPVYWPACPEAWHDMFDHTSHVSGTRAGMASLLGPVASQGGIVTTHHDTTGVDHAPRCPGGGITRRDGIDHSLITCTQCGRTITVPLRREWAESEQETK